MIDYSKLKAFSKSICGFENKDLIQDTLLYCHNKYDPSKSSEERWTYWQMRFIFHNQYRKTQVRKKNEKIYYDSVQQNDPLSDYDNKIDVDKLISKLSTKDKKIAELYKKGYNQPEIASILGCTKQNIQKTFRKIKKKFRRFYEIREFTKYSTRGKKRSVVSR